VIVGGLTNISALLLNNIFYLMVYKIKHPFFEQFRINPNVLNNDIFYRYHGHGKYNKIGEGSYGGLLGLLGLMGLWLVLGLWWFRGCCIR